MSSIVRPLRSDQGSLAYTEPIQQELDAVEKMLAEQLRSKFPYVDELVRYGCLLGGKRLRPVLLLLVAKALGEVAERHILLATVIEMIHTATLVHDDVLDAATIRRHFATVNDRWDTESSILLGDYLFTHAFHLASMLESTWACRLIGAATNQLCEGEIRQKGNQGDFGISEREYLQINESKTATLCACASRLGMPEFSDEPELAERITSFGRYLGQAFQIVDDLLDVVGQESLVGKSLGSDLQHQKATLPVIHLWSRISEKERRGLEETLRGPAQLRRDRLLPMLNRHGSVEYARARAMEFADKARNSLNGLPENAATKMLEQLPEFVVQRAH